VGEPGAAIPATRRRLAEAWGAFVGDGYGLTEILPLGSGCVHRTSTHIPDDLVITEIIDLTTGKAATDGEPGEIVLTNLICDTHPLLRFRTGDIARRAAVDACECGFSGTLLANSIEGRADDMIWFKGVNLYPSAIEEAVRSVEGVGGEFEIVIEGDGNPRMTLRVEHADGVQPDAALSGRLKESMRAKIGLSAEIELLPPASLPRTDGRKKARRLRDLRNRSAS
jgi:phenylacetate-CoA ligase